MKLFSCLPRCKSIDGATACRYVKGMSINTPSDVALIIQLSVAPVFLIAGIGTLMNVMTSRLARVVDRGRSLEASIAQGMVGAQIIYQSELRGLDQRMSRINTAITLLTLAILFVCLVIMILFLGEILGKDFGLIVAACFIAALGALIGGLVAFLSEISVATRMLRVREELLMSKAPRS
jgi:Protein of unknown function (DUF2721)